MSHKFKYLALGLFLTLQACTTVRPLTNVLSAPTAQPASAPICENDAAQIRTGYDTARVNGCDILADGSFRLVIAPEAAVNFKGETINNAAWYGFHVTPKSDKAFSIELTYGDKDHRYRPKQSYNGVNWDVLPATQVKTPNDNSAVLSFKSETQPFYISAQEIFTAQAHDSWTEKMALKPFVTQSIIGKSRDDHPISMLEVKTESNVKKPYVVWVGRQHPPEVTGALALIPFTETVLNENALSQRFLEHFNLLIIPMLNPDGVKAGNWRFNNGLTDLNRDWGPFAQPETQAAKSALQRFESGDERVVFFLDFHSTWRNLLYTQADDEPTQPPFFARDWVKAVDDRLDDKVYPFTREARHNSGKPVSKNYMFETYGISAITYEVGDKTPRSAIDLSARVFAEEMMKLLLEHETEK